MEGDDDGAEEDKASSTGSAATALLMTLVVCHTGVKACKCKLCGALSTSTSPFSDAVSDDLYGGLWPWHRYKRHPADGVSRCPLASLCRICSCVFGGGYYSSKYGSVKAYLVEIRTNMRLRNSVFFCGVGGESHAGEFFPLLDS